MINEPNQLSIAGISSIELIVVGLIIVIATAIAIPNYRTYAANKKATELATQLATAIRLAKNEAMRRQLTVKVCPLSSEGSTICNDSITAWSFGWQVMVPTTNEIIRKFQVKSPSGVVPDVATSITFSPSGYPTPNSIYFSILPTGCSLGKQVVANVTQPGLALKINNIPCL